MCMSNILNSVPKDFITATTFCLNIETNELYNNKVQSYSN